VNPALKYTLFLISLVGAPLAFSQSALIYIDAPGENENVSDEITLFEYDSSKKEMVGKGYLEANQIVTIKKNESGRLEEERIGDKVYFKTVSAEGYTYYLEKSELGVRGFATGPRDVNNEHNLKSSLVASSPFEEKTVEGIIGFPSDCVTGECEKIALPNNAQLKVLDAQVIKEKNNLGEEELKTYYSVSAEGVDGPFWISADNTATEFEDSYLSELVRTDPKKDCDPTNNNIEDLIKGAEDIENRSVDQMVDQTVETLLPHVGECFEGFSGAEAYRSKVAPKVKAASVSRVTKDELVAIDLMSRTIYGEMASCNRYGSAYLNAVAKIILNRKEYSEGHLKEAKSKPNKASSAKAKAKEFYDEKFEGVGGGFGPVILKPYAFSLWNKGDPAGDNAFCPAHPTKKSGPQDQASIDAYKEAVRAAIKAVKYPDQLKQEMKPVTQHFYTSKIAMPSQHAYNEAGVIKTSAGNIDKKSCMRLWKSKRVQSHRESLYKSGYLKAWLDSILSFKPFNYG